MGFTADFDALKHAVITESRPALTTTESEALAAKADRTLLIIENTGSEDVYVSFGGTADATAMTLVAGERLVLSGPAPTAAVNAAASATTSNLYIAEA